MTFQLTDEQQMLVRRWSIAFAWNLPLPFVMGAWVVQDRGLPGMICGVIAFWLLGVTLARLWPAAVATIIDGASFVASLQLLLVPHFIVGILAAVPIILLSPAPTSWMNDPMARLADSRGVESADGFALTTITGILLTSVAAMVGLLRWWRRESRRRGVLAIRAGAEN